MDISIAAMVNRRIFRSFSLSSTSMSLVTNPIASACQKNSFKWNPARSR